jgi:hypothetical protein
MSPRVASLALVCHLAFVVACGDGGSDPDARIVSVDAAPDARALPDAPPPDAAEGMDVACLGQPPPPEPGPTTLAGIVMALEDYVASPLANAAVELRRRADDTLVASATSGEDGRFEMGLDGPVAAYFVVAAAGALPTYTYLEAPVPHSVTLVPIIPVAEAERWYADAGATFTPDARTLLAGIYDCQGAAVPGATLAVAPAGDATVYFDADADPGQWEPALDGTTNGFAMVTGAAATTAATAHLGAAAFPAESVPVRAGAMTLLQLSPYE